MHIKFLFVLFQLAGVLSRPDGAPSAACGNMMPQHGTTAQNNANSPYSVAADKGAVTSDETVTVTVSGNTGTTQFKGILLQARIGAETTPSGTWTLFDSANYHTTCYNSQALTHSNGNNKNLPVRFKWIPPPVTANTTYVVYMTIVQVKTTYYVKLFSGNIAVSPVPATSTTLPTAVTTPPAMPMTTNNAGMTTTNAAMATASTGMTTTMAGMTTTNPTMTTTKATMSTMKESMTTTTQKMQTTSAAPSVGISALVCMISIMFGVFFVLRGGHFGY